MHDRPALRIVDRTPRDGRAGDGTRRPALLVHGSMDRASSFRRLMAQLPDWHLIAYDRRGYASSVHAGPPEGFDQQVADLVEVLDGRAVVAFGHSYGGDVVLAAAERHPGLITAALVWEPPQPWLEEWPVGGASGGGTHQMEPEAAAEWFMRRMVGDRVWERLPESTRAQRLSEGATLQAEMAAFGAQAPFTPERIRIPVIVGRGSESRPHHRRATRELAARLPHGELAEIAGAGHGAHLSHPGEVARLLRRAASRG